MLKGKKGCCTCGSGKNIKTVAVENSNTKRLQDFVKTQDMHNCAFRYKLDTSYKNSKVLIYKEKRTF